MRKLIVIMMFGALIATASACSTEMAPPPERGASLEVLFDQLRTARTMEEAQMVEATIRHVWAQSGRRQVDALMARAVEALHQGDYDTALTTLDGVVELAPDYAEGWNMRATIHYLRDEYGRAVADIEHVLVLEPRHFGALTGLGRIFLDLEQKKAALAAFEMALSIHPHLEEVRGEVDDLRDQLAGIPI